MAEKKIDITTLLNVKKGLLPKIEPVKLLFEEYVETCDFHVEQMKQSLKDYTESENPSYKVGDKVMNLKEEVKKDSPDKDDDELVSMKQEALKIIHTAIYPTQRLITEFQLQALDRVTEAYNLARSLLSTTETDLMNDESFALLVGTHTDRERIVKGVLNDLTKLFDKIDLRYRQAKNYLDWLSDQLATLNRLDSMIRLKQRISEQELYENKARRGGFEL